MASETLQLGRDCVGAITYDSITRNQIGVVIDECGAARSEKAARMQIEKDGRASEEGFPVPVESGRIELTKCGQQLALAPGPFQQRASLQDSLP